MSPDDLRKVKEYARGRLRDEIKSQPRGAQARAADELDITTAHVANLVNLKSLPGEEVLPRLAARWGMTYDQLAAAALGKVFEGEPIVERPERYSQMKVVREMGLAQGYDPEFVEKWEVHLDADEEPDADYLWTLMKAAWARHQRKTAATGDPLADLDKPLRDSKRRK